MSQANIVLDPKLTTQSATELRDQLLAETGKVLVIDASNVTQLGASACQILLAAQKSCARDGNAFEIQNASDDFQAQIALLGLETSPLTAKGM